MSSTITEFLIKSGYDTAPDSTYGHIYNWLDWYKGDVKKFHTYKVYNGVSATKHDRYRLNMAKKICEDWANLLLNEKVSIKAGDYTERLNAILDQNNFQVRANQLVEITFALGTGAFVEYKSAGGDVVIDYVRADMIYPLSWDNGDVTECAFGTSRIIQGKESIYLQIHRLGRRECGENPDVYYIENKYLDAESGEELEGPSEVMPIIPTNYSRPLFQIITPNVYNNIDLDSPLGISVYANSISQLKGCDLIYDSYVNEFILGRKRILVPIQAAKIQMQKDGLVEPFFQPDDTVYYLMPGDRTEDIKPTEVDMAIRAEDHELGIQRNLDLLGFTTGMGTGRYKFESSGEVRTATEVISDKSDLYQNRQKNAIIIRAAVVNLIRAVSFLDTGAEVMATVDLDDSIIEDVGTIIDRNIKLVEAGLRSKLTAIMDINRCAAKDAEKEMQLIAEDNKITGQDVDWTSSERYKDDGDDSEPANEPDEGRGN